MDILWKHNFWHNLKIYYLKLHHTTSILNIISSWLQDVFNLTPEAQGNILASLIVILIFSLIRLFILRVAFKKTEDARGRYYWKNSVNYTTVGLVIILVAFIWSKQFHNVFTFFGLFIAGLSIALKEPILNFFGWVFIIARRPFQVGDRIEIGGHAGDVIDVRIFQFTLNEIGNWVDADQSTGRIIHIPNARVFSTEQANYSMGFSHIWNEIPVLLTFESDWAKAKAMLQEIATHHASHLTEEAEKQLLEASKRFMIYYSNLDPIVYTKVNDHGVLLSIRYLCLPQRRRTSEQNIWEEVLQTFAQHEDIEFAYPTQRFYNYPQESRGKTKPNSF